MRSFKFRALRLAYVVATAGTIYQIGGCSPGGAFNFARNLNPCGSILVCDPVSYNFLTSGYDGPGVDPDADPFCTFPPFCTPDDDPIINTGDLP